MLACPAHNDIPSAMWLIEQGEFLGGEFDAAPRPLNLAFHAIKAQVAPAELAPAFVRAITLNPGVAQAVQTAGGPLPLFRARIADDGWLKAHMQYVAALVQQLNVAMRSLQPQQ